MHDRLVSLRYVSRPHQANTYRCSGEYCDVQLAKRGSNPCSDCSLKTLASHFDSPHGFDDELASSFTSLTSSCSATGYTINTPTPPPWSSIVTADAVPSPTINCVRTYHKPPGQTCDEMARSQSVSTLALIKANHWDLFCAFIPSDATDICLPEQCKTATFSDQDTCNTFSWANSITVDQLREWNPDINAQCSNLNRFYNSQLCVGPPSAAPASNVSQTCKPPVTLTAPVTATLPSDWAELVSPGVPFMTQMANTTDACAAPTVTITATVVPTASSISPLTSVQVPSSADETHATSTLIPSSQPVVGQIVDGQVQAPTSAGLLPASG